MILASTRSDELGRDIFCTIPGSRGGEGKVGLRCYRRFVGPKNSAVGVLPSMFSFGNDILHTHACIIAAPINAFTKSAVHHLVRTSILRK